MKSDHDGDEGSQPHGHYKVLHSPSSAPARAAHHSALQTRVSHKIQINLHEMHKGRLHSGSKHGPLVTNPKQAIAISESQARKGMG